MPRASRRGFTLVETLVAIVVAGIIMAYAFPKVRTTLIKSNLRSARSAVLSTLQQAKVRAVNENRTMAVKLNTTTGALWIEGSPRKVALSGSTADTVGPMQNLTTSYQATIANTSPTSLAFDHRGMLTPLGTSQQTVKVSNGSFSDSVMINGYGGITK